MKTSKVRSALFVVMTVFLIVPADTGTHAQAPAQEKAGDAFYVAIRSNDVARVTALLAGGADVNTRGEQGVTPLMYAAWVGSAEAMKLLLDRGADPNLTNGAGSTALMLSVTEPAKVKLLLDRKADVNKATPRGRTALLIAAMAEPSATVVKMLIAAGADVRAVDQMKITTLSAAAGGNDTETVRMMVDAGLDVNATDFFGFTPLVYAATNHNLDVVRMLLAKGAKVNVVSSDGSFQKVKAGTIALGNFTPLSSAVFAPFPVVKALLDAGADVNVKDVRGMNTLMLAVATDRPNLDTIKALIAKGVDVNAKSLAGETSLDWARKNGSTPIIDVLTKAGAVGTTAPPVVVPAFAPANVRTSAERSVALLEKSTVSAAAGGGCASCHSHNITDFVVELARAKGLRVDDKAQGERRTLTKAPYFAPLTLLERIDGAGFPDVPLFALGALAAQGYEADRTTDAIVANAVGFQSADGVWKAPHGAVARPPIEDGDFYRTALAIGALKIYGPPARADIKERIARARDWLLAAKPMTTDDRNFQLIGLECAGADKAVLQRLSKAILGNQLPDGGWAQRAELKSDAYATGETLYALASTGQLAPSSAAYQKGIKFLLATQHADGSWYVKSRSPKFYLYFDGGFPYAHDQWISSMATGYASAALLLTLEDAKRTASR